MLTWLADVLRAEGLTVVEHSGWKTRARPGSWSPTYGVIHATAAPRSQADDRQVAIVRDGRSDLPGPIANATVDRQGRWHILGAGRCNSTLVGTAGPYEGRGNTNALSTEACNDNVSEPWPPAQYEAYVRGWAAWCRRLGWKPDRLVGHKEHTPGHKTDPTFSMSRFRADVAAALAGKYTSGGMDDMFVRRGDKGQGVRYLQRRIERLGILVDKKPIVVDSDYGPSTQAFVKAAELAWNKDFKGDGSEATAETWTRLDDMYFAQLAKQHAGQPGKVDDDQVVGAIVRRLTITAKS